MKGTTSFFRMDSGYESEEIVEVIEEAGYQYVVKAKEYSKQSEEVCSGQGIKTGRRQKTTQAGLKVVIIPLPCRLLILHGSLPTP
jgi:hypothetical protein